MALKFAVNNSLSAVTSLPTAIPTGSMTLLQTQTASSSASLEFSMDSTYDSYVFKFINIHPSTSGAYFQFNFSTDGGSNYNVTKTSSGFVAYHNEADTATGLIYEGGIDLAQSTSYQTIAHNLGNGNDENSSGNLQIFNPSSTTFVKHYLSDINFYNAGSVSVRDFIGGYGNTTSAITNIKFQMNSGNIDSGVIKLYGIS